MGVWAATPASSPYERVPRYVGALPGLRSHVCVRARAPCARGCVSPCVLVCGRWETVPPCLPSSPALTAQWALAGWGGGACHVFVGTCAAAKLGVCVRVVCVSRCRACACVRLQRRDAPPLRRGVLHQLLLLPLLLVAAWRVPGAAAQASITLQEVQKAQLLFLHSNTGGSSWIRSDNWNVASDHCTFFGVECNPDGYVTCVPVGLAP